MFAESDLTARGYTLASTGRARWGFCRLEEIGQCVTASPEWLRPGVKSIIFRLVGKESGRYVVETWERR